MTILKIRFIKLITVNSTTTDKETVVDLTHHSYFNFVGSSGGSMPPLSADFLNDSSKLHFQEGQLADSL